jgi:hypothetical protein
MLSLSSKAALALGFAVSLIFSVAAIANSPVSCERLAFEFKAQDVVLSSSTLNENVIGFMGQHFGPKSMAAENTSSFFRLYMVPGMAHCGGGTAHASVDWLTPLVDWVENGVVPQAIVGIRTSDNSTRPHCPYSQVAIYDGAGDAADAACYSCGRL